MDININKLNSNRKPAQVHKHTFVSRECNNVQILNEQHQAQQTPGSKDEKLFTCITRTQCANLKTKHSHTHAYSLPTYTARRIVYYENAITMRHT